MRGDLDTLLRGCGGAASRQTLVRHGIATHTIDNEVRSGLLVTAATDVYCRPWDVDDIELRERATLLSLGRAAALSHLTGLRRWALPVPTCLPVHASVPATRAPRSREGLVVHRVARFPPVVRLNGLVTVTAAEAVVTSWPLLPVDEGRRTAIDATRRRIASPADLALARDRHPRLRGRTALRDLVGLLAQGCESELEIWGHLGVFDVAGLRHAVRQYPVVVGGQRFRLDLAYRDERVAVELDGRAFHFGAEQRERDMLRDALLASIGWLTLRFSHRRLHTDVDGCRRDTLAALAARRR